MVSSSKNDGAAFFCFQKQVWRIAILKHTYKLIFEHENRLKMSTTFLQMKIWNSRYVKTLQAGRLWKKCSAWKISNHFALTRYGNYCNLIFWWVQLFSSTVVVRIPNLAFCHSFTVSLRIEKKINFSHPPTDIVFWGGEAEQKKKLFKSSLKSQLRNYNSTHVKECKTSFAAFAARSTMS